ncbi:thiamine ABC transporter ATP-binding protein [Pseudaestuariivita rosea]|uniref:thiamine ABC transporter ATP-binding protein n=1 Tax=Pseudaestuariivita rosea TaxID=2763263 RepID=UPI001ABB801E|nr:thiamine ABC transporter ATP-binding protein [Pseudaestuariivita rosea]
MLTLEGLRIDLGDFHLGADLTVAKGHSIAVMGPSGAGKSTLFNAIAGFLQPSAGRILWNGADITTRTPADRPIALLFQDNNLFPHLTAFQNVALGLRPDLHLTPAHKDQVMQALDKVGLRGFEDRKPGALSGGQQSRVALARVMLQAKPLILLDEPFAALGPALKAEMLDLVKQTARDNNATLLMITHDPKDAERIADQIIVVADGQANPPAPAAKVLAHPPAALRDYLGL